MSSIKEIKAMSFPWETRDPFLFCVHHLDQYPSGDEDMAPPKEALQGRSIGNDFTIKDGWRMYHGSKVPGFPFHPHRGFETITINKQGFVDHSDSLGAAGRFGSGDTQWMTAGKGVLHSEMFPLLNKQGDNTLEIFQIWINLPKVSKFVEPHFKMLWNQDVPKLELKDDAGKRIKLELIAGKYLEHSAPSPTPNSWASDAKNEVGVMCLELEAGAKWTLPAISAGANRAVYFYKGSSLNVEGQDLTEYQMAYLSPDAEIEFQNGDSKGLVLILQGQPIQEPVAQYGPFVMNTKQEIQDAFNDYQETQFGGWPWPMQEQVHERDRGRFALHSDGKEELPES
ncbi:MAG TPA: pirin [Flavobacteriales bacterium]|nr:pirin [Flavobacteriales bacterium]